MVTLETGSIVKYCNEDFKVKEVSLWPSDVTTTPLDAAFTLLTTKKEGYTTFEAINALCLFFELPREAVRCQGLKDEDGITEQLISIAKVIDTTQAGGFNNAHAVLPKGWISIAVAGYAKEPVQEKRLHGNLFDICVRNFTHKQAVALELACKDGQDFICANYYDQQRFGLPDGPYVAHRIGEAIVKGDWTEAEEYYRQSGNVDLDFPPGTNRPSGLLVQDIDQRKLQFFIGAYSSYIWNQRLSKELAGDLALSITETHTVNVPTQFTASSLPLLVEADSYKLQDGHVTARRKARAGFISTTVFVKPAEPDTAFVGRLMMRFQFFLPTGSYATMLLKQLIARSQANVR